METTQSINYSGIVGATAGRFCITHCTLIVADLCTLVS